jgi:hypothetical protein
MRKVLATVVGAAAFLGACSSPSHSDNPLLSELSLLTGPSARQCGLVTLGQDPSIAWKCAQTADKSGEPYWFAMQRQGVDSDIWLAALLTPSGQRYILTYDSNYMGGPGLLPRFSRDTCSGRIVLSPKSRSGLQCSRR